MNLWKSDVTGQVAWAQLNFLVTGTLVPPGNIFYIFGPAFGDVLTAGLGPCCRTLSNDNEYILFVNDAGGQKVVGGAFNNYNFPAGTYLPGEACAYVSLYSARPGRAGRGIFRCAILDETMFDGAYISAGMQTACTALGNFLCTPFTVYGLTFTPVIWSRSLGTFDPIVRFEVGNMVTRLHKRRPWRRKKNTELPATINWP